MLRPVGEKPNRDRSSSSMAGNPAGDVCTCVHLRPRNPSGKLPRSLSSLLPFHRHERASRFENPLSDPAAMSSVSRCTWPGFGTGYCARRLPSSSPVAPTPTPVAGLLPPGPQLRFPHQFPVLPQAGGRQGFPRACMPICPAIQC